MDKEDFDASSSTIKKFAETCVCYEECKPKRPRKAAQLVKATLREKGSARPNTKPTKRLALNGTKNTHDVTLISKDITIANAM
eukprot:7569918-Ditylum_brightwellii.AAC.1